ncbi:hypothetical protein Tco_0554951, partial [Tanacetum coccineum]
MPVGVMGGKPGGLIWFAIGGGRYPEFPWLKFAAAACETYSWMLSR